MLTYQINATDYVKAGDPAKFLLAQEKDKGGRLIGNYIVSLMIPGGAPETRNLWTQIHEVPITKEQYDALKSLGIFEVLEYQPKPDPVILPPILSTTDPWQYMADIGFGLAKYLQRNVAVAIARQYGYMGN